MSAYYVRKRGDTAQPFRYTATYSDGTVPNFVGATVEMRVSAWMGGHISTTTGTISGVVFSCAAPAFALTLGSYGIDWLVTYDDGSTETWPSKGHLRCEIYEGA